MKTNQVKPVVVKQAENQEPIPAEIIAQSIKRVAESNRRMRRAGLSERAIILLLHDASGIGKPAIKEILRSLDQLERLYLTT